MIKDRLLDFIYKTQQKVDEQARSFDGMERKKGADMVLDDLRKLLKEENDYFMKNGN